MNKLVLLFLVATCSLYAGGFRIPETSTNAVALGAANIAHNQSADAAYYNPANMVFMDDKNFLEADLTYIGLKAVNFKGSSSGLTGRDINAESESFLIPSIHYVSGKRGEARVGLSITAPGGLSKRWNTAPGIYSAKEFTLEVIEVNPSIAIPLSDKLAIAFGFRMVYSEGIIKSSASISRDMEADSMDYGYNLALSYKPTSELEMALTYRSKVDLTEEGNAKLYSDAGITLVYNGAASVTVPLPAIASAAIAYTFETKTTLELVYERNMWSAYKTLDFEFPISIGGMKTTFDDPKAKNWKDSTAIRIGLTQELEKVTLMAGLVFDESPAPDSTLGYELPDSDSVSVSLGGRYQINENLDIALAGLYSFRDERTVSQGGTKIIGTFSHADVYLISAGVGYKF